MTVCIVIEVECIYLYNYQGANLIKQDDSYENAQKSGDSTIPFLSGTNIVLSTDLRELRSMPEYDQ